MVNQWKALSVSTMASNAGVCVCMQKEGVKSEKKGQERRVRRWKKRGKEDKQGRQDALASQHALTSAFMSAEHPLTRGRSPWHTAFTNAVCVAMDDKEQEPSENTNQSHTQCFWALPCV